jgi:hypothetical protein
MAMAVKVFLEIVQMMAAALKVQCIQMLKTKLELNELLHY